MTIPYVHTPVALLCLWVIPSDVEAKNSRAIHLVPPSIAVEVVKALWDMLCVWEGMGDRLESVSNGVPFKAIKMFPYVTQRFRGADETER